MLANKHTKIMHISKIVTSLFYFQINRVTEIRGNTIKYSEPGMLPLAWRWRSVATRVVSIDSECVSRFWIAHLFQPEHSPLSPHAVKSRSLAHLLRCWLLVALSASFIHYWTHAFCLTSAIKSLSLWLNSRTSAESLEGLLLFFLNANTAYCYFSLKCSSQQTT